MMNPTETEVFCHLSPVDQQLFREAESLFAGSEFSKAAKILLSRLEAEMPSAELPRRVLVAAVSGRLVDYGSYGQREGLIEKGLGLMDKYEDELRAHLGEPVFLYNLANGKNSLYGVKLASGQRYKLDGLDLLTQAKNDYWKAFRSLESTGTASQWPELLINLANTLRTAGRVTEALHWYEEALKVSPAHPMAHANRASCLDWFGQMSCQHSVAMLAQIRDDYLQALRDTDLPTNVREEWSRRLAAASSLLTKHEYDEDKALHDQIETQKEAEEHSAYRNFCLSQGLVLCEHAIYCRCAGARRDDLTIATVGGVVSAHLPRMEFILNRVKAEFGLARSLYYQALTKNEDKWDTEPYEETYTDLGDDAATGLNAEMLRTSFRLCFGILDRIGFAICNHLNLARSGENVYFERFWRSRSLSKEKREERWQILNENCTPGLIALYSQATDLNSASGEWGHFKQWRNKLEHELLILVRDHGKGLGPLIPKDDLIPIQIPYSKFVREALHMLRFTASAIFNYALWARQHALDKESQDVEGVAPHELAKKPLGPK